MEKENKHVLPAGKTCAKCDKSFGGGNDGRRCKDCERESEAGLY